MAPITPPSTSRHSSSRAEWFVIALGIVCVALMIASLFVSYRERDAQHNAELATGTIRRDLALAHLRDEEMMSGNTSVDFNKEVLGYIDNVSHRVQVLRDGGVLAEGEVHAEQDAEARALLDALLGWNKEWRDVTMQRRNDKAHGLPGSDLEQLHDALFEKLQTFSTRYSDHLNARRARRDHWRDVGNTITAGLLLVSLLTTFGMLRRRRLQAREDQRRLERAVAERTQSLALEIEAHRDTEDDLRASQHDLADSLQKVREAAREQKRLAAIAESTPDLVATAVMDGSLLYINPGARSVLGLALDADITGYNVAQFLPATTMARARTEGFAQLRQRGNWSGETYLQKLNGEVIPVSFVVIAHCEEGSERIHSVSYLVRDISISKRVEEELRRAQHEAEAANRAKSAFLANISHEIRTPLNAITGMVELMDQTSDPVEQTRMLRVTQESSRALAGIIDDVLDFSKIEAGQLDISLDPVSVREAINSVVTIFSSSASAKNLQLSQRFDERIPAALICDALRLKQILFNLVGNAIKFTSQGSIEIRTRLHELTVTAAVIRVEVADSGIGISAEAQQKLFQPFVQADADTTRRFGGTGLGLVISRRLAELLGGTLEISSVAGEGTTMTLTLKLKRTEMPLKAPVNATAPATCRQGPTTSASGKLLIADDNAINRQVLVRQLVALGYAADHAANGREALDLWRAGAYDLVITDCHMPELDGYGLARCIRELEAVEPQHGRVPIIGYTANALQESKALCLAAGMDDALIKPVALRALQDKLLAWLGPINATVSQDKSITVESSS